MENVVHNESDVVTKLNSASSLIENVSGTISNAISTIKNARGSEFVSSDDFANIQNISGNYIKQISDTANSIKEKSDQTDVAESDISSDNDDEFTSYKTRAGIPIVYESSGDETQPVIIRFRSSVDENGNPILVSNVPPTKNMFITVIDENGKQSLEKVVPAGYKIKSPILFRTKNGIPVIYRNDGSKSSLIKFENGFDENDNPIIFVNEQPTEKTMYPGKDGNEFLVPSGISSAGSKYTTKNGVPVVYISDGNDSQPSVASFKNAFDENGKPVIITDVIPSDSTLYNEEKLVPIKEKENSLIIPAKTSCTAELISEKKTGKVIYYNRKVDVTNQIENVQTSVDMPKNLNVGMMEPLLTSENGNIDLPKTNFSNNLVDNLQNSGVNFNSDEKRGQSVIGVVDSSPNNPVIGLVGNETFTPDLSSIIGNYGYNDLGQMNTPYFLNDNHFPVTSLNNPLFDNSNLNNQ